MSSCAKARRHSGNTIFARIVPLAVVAGDRHTHTQHGWDLARSSQSEQKSSTAQLKPKARKRTSAPSFLILKKV